MQTYSENKKAYYDYEILEKYEAGLVLQGQEVKSIKMGHINLTGSYVTFRGSEPYLIGAKIPPYQPKNAPADYNPEQSRKLLLNKKEIHYLMGKVNERGFSLIPLKIYEQNGRIKLEFGLARGKGSLINENKLKKGIQKEILVENSKNNMYYVYVLQSLRDKDLYVGHTDNLIKRFKEHNTGLVQSTKIKKPLKLVYYEACNILNDAIKREKSLKTGFGRAYLKRRLSDI